MYDKGVLRLQHVSPPPFSSAGPWQIYIYTYIHIYKNMKNIIGQVWVGYGKNSFLFVF